jgi:hypothetical protein
MISSIPHSIVALQNGWWHPFMDICLKNFNGCNKIAAAGNLSLPVVMFVRGIVDII